MPRDGTNLHPEEEESSAELLARAIRVRHYAQALAGIPAENRLEQFADQLEARARQASRSRTGSQATQS